MRRRTLFSSMFDPLLRPCSKFTCRPLAAQAPAVNSYRLSGITLGRASLLTAVMGKVGTGRALLPLRLCAIVRAQMRRTIQAS